MSRLREKLTYANVMSTLAVFLLLGGGAYAAKQKLIDTNDIANQAVTGKKIAKSTIKSKNLKDGKGVTGADVKDGAIGDADLGSGIGGAKLADGSVAVEKLTPLEPVHVVGTSGEPRLGNGGEGDCVWSDGQSEVPDIDPASFRMDRDGVVHMYGAVLVEEVPGVGDEECGATAPEPNDDVEDFTAFTLPPAYRPANAQIFDPGSTGADAIYIAGIEPWVLSPSATLPAGAVVIAGPPPFGALLSHISFPAASSGLLPNARAAEPSSSAAKALGLPGL